MEVLNGAKLQLVTGKCVVFENRKAEHQTNALNFGADHPL